tara:strand:- start:10676 stop:11365 length:690 start_codon:yes stop_codon:yes gene_type:complete
VKAKKIGVLGGIGPEATGNFYLKLITRLQEEGLIKSNQDFPQIFINSIPAPELIFDNISGEDLLPYVQGLKELDKLNPDFIVMVCNTIHLFYDRLQKEVNTPIINLKQELKDSLTKRGIDSVFIIATPNCIKQGLYRFNGLKIFEPNDKEMNKLTDAIFNFNKGLNKQAQVKLVKSICQKYLNKGAKTVILGCTEFAVMLGNETFPKINTIDVLVEAVVEVIPKHFYNH